MILSSPNPLYIGRFAPSPTGPLHLGSLYTALASFLDARHHGGRWLLRIDDLDTPRNVDGAADAILHCLHDFGLDWDSEIDFQSRHVDEYTDQLHALFKAGNLYACRCSRKDLIGHALYPGYCRDAAYADDNRSALRVRTDMRRIAFHDGLQGHIDQNLSMEHGDFVVRRRDGIVAYQFAVVLDDRRQAVNHVVRGTDLLDSTPKQIYLQQLLDYPAPAYLHLPVIVDSKGQKLSKQTLAAPVDNRNSEQTLWQLLELLRQNPPAELQGAPVAEQLRWAVTHWQPQALKKIRAIESPIH